VECFSNKIIFSLFSMKLDTISRASLKCGTSSAPTPKSLKPYVNINGSANNRGYNVQVGAGVKTNIGSIGVTGNANGNWHGHPNTSIKGDLKF
jgi:hypothetical protein